MEQIEKIFLGKAGLLRKAKMTKKLFVLKNWTSCNVIVIVNNWVEQVKSFDSERRKLESRIEKLTKQIAVLEKAVEDNR